MKKLSPSRFYSRSFFRNRRGQTLVEYALLLLLIAIVVIAAVRVIGTKTNNMYSSVAGSLN